MKRTMQSERIESEAMEALTDRLSDLPDSVLLHIINFMNLIDAVRTCVLSKRWKDLWKRLTNLSLSSSDFSRLPHFNKFVSSVLSRRDGSISLHKLDLKRVGCIEPKLLNMLMTYAASHDVQQMTINVGLCLKKDFELPSSVFYCRSLTSLNLSLWKTFAPAIKIKFPKSLELPALRSLHIKDFTFATSDNGCAEPFSTCNMLNTLVIEDCYLESDAKVLRISNSKLLRLTIFSYHYFGKAYEITLSTPNLNLLTIKGDPDHQLSSTCNITCLEEGNLNVNWLGGFLTKDMVLTSWLQVLVNVKILTLSWYTFEILNALLSRGSIKTQLPCFVRLKSLKLKMDPFSNIPDEVISMMVEYLLQNSPLTRVDIIKCCTLEGV